jgi:N-acetyl sugar amidotransferase
MKRVIDVPPSTTRWTKDEIVFCRNCVMPSTRPRIEFDARGFCNACVWAEEKKTLVDWEGRWKKLEALCDKHRRKDGFDCIVGVSGGKDGSYVSYMLKHKLGMTPLALTVTVPLAMEVGDSNLHRFVESGYDHMKVTPNPHISREYNRIGLVEQGRPLWGWQINLQAVLLRVALAHQIPLIMYGEDGEVEYGGSSESKNTPAYDVAYAIRVYLSGYDPASFISRFGGRFSEKDLHWWRFPAMEEIEKLRPQASHFSYFENWDPYEHYVAAKEHCGLQERESASSGTYTNFAQTDTLLFDLHMYFAFLKFGFGRCSQDVGIDIRRGAMTRKQAMELVKIYDHLPPPDEYVEKYLEYYGMTHAEFQDVIDRHANKAILKKENGVWVRNFEIS